MHASNIFCTCHMLLDCFPNTHGRHIWMVYENYFEHAQQFLELPNAVPYASVRSQTASMLLEHTEYFPNMIRSLPEHPNSSSESKRNDIRASVIAPLWSNQTDPNAMPYAFRIRKLCEFLKLPKCPFKYDFPNVSPNAFRLLSECFQYAFRIYRILSAC